MTDNIIQFPKENHFAIELEEEATMIENVGEIIDIFTQGLNAAHDIDPETLMSAMMQGAAIWGLRAGMTADEVMDSFKMIKIRLEDSYDA